MSGHINTPTLLLTLATLFTATQHIYASHKSYVASATPERYLIQTYLQKHPNLMEQRYRMQIAANQNIQQFEKLSKADIQQFIQISPQLQKIISTHMNRLHQESLQYPNHNMLNKG